MRQPFRFWMTGSVAVVMTTASVGRTMASDRQLLSQSSRFRVTETVQRIEACAQKHGLSVFARLSQAAKRPGDPGSDAIVVVFESATGGTPVVMAAADAAPEAPLAVCVRTDAQGRTEVLFNGSDWDDLPAQVTRDLTELPILVADALGTGGAALGT